MRNQQNSRKKSFQLIPGKLRKSPFVGAYGINLPPPRNNCSSIPGPGASEPGGNDVLAMDRIHHFDGNLPGKMGDNFHDYPMQ